ncbi:Csu type fimbrial protein [Lysobacter sp. A286]
MNLFKTSLLATALIAGGAIAPANAADNMNFDVTITIDKSCDVTSTSDVSFNSRFASAGTVSTNGGVTIQCTVDVPYNVALNAGNNGGTDITARKMLISGGGTDTIAYQLYQDTAQTVWGQTVGTDTVTGTGIGFGAAATFNQPHTVYAEATIVGTEPVGSYSDTITATVKF